MITNISSTQAWEMLSTNKTAELIDVRTQEEWKFTGIPNLKPIKKTAILLSWQEYPDMKTNRNFISTINNIFMNKNTPILLLCRSGYRSHQAALSIFAEGYSNCYNIIDGFEGKIDHNSHRNCTEGWKYEDLPWLQD